jgi:hypothetical protein
MNLIASAVTQAFHSDGVHARYVIVGEQDENDTGAIIHLNLQERKTVADALLNERLRLKAANEPYDKAEQLLRRLVGSVSEFVALAGERPLDMTAHDRATIAIADGNLNEFDAALYDVRDGYGGLLCQAAARPDRDGLEMTARILETAPGFTQEEYLAAVANAVKSADSERVLMLMRNAGRLAPDLDAGFYGKAVMIAITYRHNEDRRYNMAFEMAHFCTPEQIQAAKPELLTAAAFQSDSRLARLLLDRRAPMGDAYRLFVAAASKNDYYLAEKLIEAGADCTGFIEASENGSYPASESFLSHVKARWERHLEEQADISDSLDDDEGELEM